MLNPVKLKKNMFKKIKINKIKKKRKSKRFDGNGGEEDEVRV